MKLAYERGGVRVYEKPESDAVTIVHAQTRTHRVLAYEDEYPQTADLYAEIASRLALQRLEEDGFSAFGEVQVATSEAVHPMPGDRDRPMLWVKATWGCWPPAPEDDE